MNHPSFLLVCIPYLYGYSTPAGREVSKTVFEMGKKHSGERQRKEWTENASNG